MVHAHAALPRFAIDGKRIAATSAVIALHVGILMLLMMPAQVAQSVAIDDTDDIVWIDQKVEVKQPPPPPIEKPRPEHATAQARPPVAQQQEQPEFPPSNDPGPLDFQQQVELPPAVIDTGKVGSLGPAFVQLATDRAPIPPFPPMAKSRRWTGSVQLRIHVDATGKPIEVEVENGSGHAMLDIAAQQFVQSHWHFVPATADGVPTEAWALVSIDYVLN